MKWKLEFEAGAGQRLREERRRLGLSQEELAAKIGVSKMTLLAYEKETSVLSLPILQKLSDAGVDLMRVLTPSAPASIFRTDLIAPEFLAAKAPQILAFLQSAPGVEKNLQRTEDFFTGIAAIQSFVGTVEATETFQQRGTRLTTQELALSNAPSQGGS